MSTNPKRATVRSKVLASVRLAGQVVRYHTWPMHTRETIAEHTWQVMRLYIQLFGPMEPSVSYYIMFHDVGEMVTGDMPFPVKRDNPDLKKAADGIEFRARHKMGLAKIELSTAEAWRIKVCDLLDMWERGLQEVAMGNMFAHPIVEDVYDNVMRMVAAPPEGVSPEHSARVVSYLKSHRSGV